MLKNSFWNHSCSSTCSADTRPTWANESCLVYSIEEDLSARTGFCTQQISQSRKNSTVCCAFRGAAIRVWSSLTQKKTLEATRFRYCDFACRCADAPDLECFSFILCLILHCHRYQQVYVVVLWTFLHSWRVLCLKRRTIASSLSQHPVFVTSAFLLIRLTSRSRSGPFAASRFVCFKYWLNRGTEIIVSTSQIRLQGCTSRHHGW